MADDTVRYTPGPWVTFNYGGDVGEGDFEGLGVCQQGKSLAVMMGDPNGFVCDCPTSKHQEANARLIAAAPDLLEALKAFLNACDAAGKDDDLSIVDTITAEMEDAARAAIAKAEGRT